MEYKVLYKKKNKKKRNTTKPRRNHSPLTRPHTLTHIHLRQAYYTHADLTFAFTHT